MCKICYWKVQSFCHQLHCVNCAGIFHAKCVKLEKDELHTRLLWYCPCCVQTIFPYHHTDDDDEFYSVIMEGVLGYSYNFHEMNQKVFIPFEINYQSDTPLTEIDPDMQFYLETNYIKNTKCDYYMEDTFIKRFATPRNHSKNCHLNIKKSAPALWRTHWVSYFVKFWVYISGILRNLAEWMQRTPAWYSRLCHC